MNKVSLYRCAINKDVSKQFWHFRLDNTGMYPLEIGLNDTYESDPPFLKVRNIDSFSLCLCIY